MGVEVAVGLACKAAAAHLSTHRSRAAATCLRWSPDYKGHPNNVSLVNEEAAPQVRPIEGGTGSRALKSPRVILYPSWQAALTGPLG